jgi:carboxylesterase type B
MAGTENFEHWSKGYQSLDCGKLHTAETIMACMRNKTSEEVMNAFSGLGFGPSTDWKLVHKEMGPLLAAGNYIQKPTLIGHTAYESDTFAHRTIIKRPYPPVQLSNNKTAIVNETQNALINESFLICSIGRLAKARTAKKIPTWLYTYAGDFPNQKTSPNMTTKPWHGSEVGLIFGTTSFTRLLPDTTEQTELAKKMREAWTSFAKAPETGLDKLKWPKYDPSGMLVRF